MLTQGSMRACRSQVRSLFHAQGHCLTLTESLAWSRSELTHMYIMPDSRPLFLAICSVIMPDQASVYVSATCSFRCTIAFAGSSPLGQQFVQFMMAQAQILNRSRRAKEAS